MIIRYPSKESPNAGSQFNRIRSNQHFSASSTFHTLIVHYPGRGGQSQQASTQQIRNVANQAAGLADSAAMSASVDAALDLQAAAAASIMADRSERLAESLAAAGIQDMEEGEELLEASENVEMLGDILESVGTEAIESGLKLARIGGELAALHGAINALNAPFLKPVGFRDSGLDSYHQFLKLTIPRIYSNSSSCHARES